MKLDDLTLDVEQHININAGPEKVFAAMLHRFGEGNTRPDGESLNLRLEPKPGGRWYRSGCFCPMVARHQTPIVQDDYELPSRTSELSWRCGSRSCLL